MDKAVTRRIKMEGCQITVVMRKEDFDVFVEITPEIDTSCKIRFRKLMVRFMNTNNAEITGTVRIEHRNVKYDKSSAYNNVRLKTTTDTYICEISLPPKFYVPDSVLKKAEEAAEEKAKKQNRKNNFSDIIVTGPVRHSNKLPHNMTIYTNNNIAKPYVGGRCSPK